MLLKVAPFCATAVPPSCLMVVFPAAVPSPLSMSYSISSASTLYFASFAGAANRTPQFMNSRIRQLNSAITAVLLFFIMTAPLYMSIFIQPEMFQFT